MGNIWLSMKPKLTVVGDTFLAVIGCFFQMQKQGTSGGRLVLGFSKLKIKTITSQIILIMGSPAVGKSTVSRELSCRLQKLSKKSILVDADTLAEYGMMPLPNEFGLDARMKRAEMTTR